MRGGLARPAAAVATLLAGAACAGAPAAEMRLAPPGVDWTLRFETFPGLAGEGRADGDRYAWAGTTGRTRVAFEVGPPRCPGALAQGAVYECVNTALERELKPADYASERGFTLGADGLFVHWRDVAPAAFEAEALFVRDGRWVELHATTTSPEPDDVRRLLALADSVAIVPASSPPAARPAPAAPPIARARVDIPGQGWAIRFDAPEFRRVRAKDTPGQYMMVGTAEPFNVSLYVEPPKCDGGDGPERLRACFMPLWQRSPYFVAGSEAFTTLPGGAVLVTFDMDTTFKGDYLRLTDAHVLFAHGGKWGDLHASFVRAAPAQVAVLRAIGDSFEIVDDAVPAASAASR